MVLLGRPVVFSMVSHSNSDTVSGNIRCLTDIDGTGYCKAQPWMRQRDIPEALQQWAYYQICKIASCACAGNAGNVFPATDFKGNRLLAIPVCRWWWPWLYNKISHTWPKVVVLPQTSERYLSQFYKMHLSREEFGNIVNQYSHSPFAIYVKIYLGINTYFAEGFNHICSTS